MRFALKKAVGVAFAMLMGVMCCLSDGYAQTEDQALSKDVMTKALSAARSNKTGSGNKTRRSSSKLAAAAETKLGPHIRQLRARRDPAVRQQSASERNSRIGDKSLAGFSVGNPFLQLRADGYVQVYITVENTGVSALAALTAAGLDVELTSYQQKKVQGWIAVDRVDALAAIDNVRKITAPRYGTVRAGSRNTAGDSILRANRLRQQGLLGQGVRVGVISDGANNWSTARSSGNLPSSITRYGSCSRRAADPRNCSGERTCNEGTAMAEIIHDIAPAAVLAVAAAGTSLEFIQRVNQLANNFRADIIVDDLGFLAEPYFEDGEIARAVAAVSGKVLFVSSAGNSADGHYERQYRRDLSSTLHDFGRAAGQTSDTDMGLVVPARSGLLAILQWNDPYEAATSDYDLYLYNNTGIEIASAVDQLSGDPTAIEGFCFYNSSTSDVVRWIGVDKFSGSDKRLEMLISNRGANQYNDATGSIFGHPGVEGVVAVGAINASDPGNNSIAFYSSRGPARVDFPAVKNRKKPDLVAIDGVQVSGAGGFPSPFFGTSAAAPHVAGIAAQLMSVSPSVRPIQVRRALTGSAIDLGPNGFDSTYGYGRVDAVLARALLRYGFTIAPVMLLLEE